MGKANAWLPDDNDKFARLSAVYGQIREVGRTYGRLAFGVRPVNWVRNEAGAGMTNRIYRQREKH